MVVAQGLLIVIVGFLVLDSMFALSDLFSPEVSSSKPRERVGKGMEMGGGDEEKEAEEFREEEREIVQDFTQMENYLDGIESAEYDLESEFEAYKSYMETVDELRSSISHVIKSFNFESLDHQYRFVKKVIEPSLEEIEELREEYGESNPVHNVYDALLDAIEDRIEDTDSTVDDLVQKFKEERETLQEGIRDLEHDMETLDTDDIDEVDREEMTRREAADIVNTNSKIISQLDTTDQELDRVSEDLDKAEKLNSRISKVEKDMDNLVTDVREKMSDYSSAYRRFKKSNEGGREELEETLDNIIVSFYGEDPSKLEKVTNFVKNLTNDVEEQEPALLKTWDEMLGVFDDLEQKHEDLVEELDRIEKEIEVQEERHHTS